MSVIGGIFDFERGDIDACGLNAMRVAMSLRAGARSNAYLGGFVGMLHSSSSGELSLMSEDDEPAIFERRGSVYSLTLDADGAKSAAVFEKYRIYGVDFLGRLCGGFALALYDGERRMLLLARDRRGEKPLFYRIYKGKLYYASEIKGLYAATGGGISVSREMLSLHICAPVGVYRAVNLLTDVKEVLPGECLLVTELGMSRFRYREAEKRRRAEKRREAGEIRSPYDAQRGESLSELLSNSLLCFDYPQFDCDMPALCALLSAAHKKGVGELFFEDRLRRVSLSYSLERADRLGALYSVRAVGVIARAESLADDGYRSKLHRNLLEAVRSLSGERLALLTGILGEKKLGLIIERCARSAEGKEKKDTDAEVRILGILCQTVMWAESRELVIKSCPDGMLQSALSTI